MYERVEVSEVGRVFPDKSHNAIEFEITFSRSLDLSNVRSIVFPFSKRLTSNRNAIYCCPSIDLLLSGFAEELV